jgi:gliding motility-associated-like protein
VMSLSDSAVKCIGDHNGEIFVNAAGGTPPYNYSATQDGVNFVYATDGVIVGLATGFYTVLIDDNNGCTLTDTTTVPNAVPDIYILTEDSTSCYGIQYTDGAIHVNGTVMQNSPYQYALDGSTSQYSGDFYNLGAGTYQLTLTNRHGCVTDTTTTIFEPANGIAEILPADTTITLGESIQLFSSLSPYNTASITSYSWVPSTGLSCADCPAPVVMSYAHINEYTLTITYNNSCTASASARVIVIGTTPLFIPNSFSPNGDGNNDIFLIYGENIKTVSLKVFNRWGEKVFDSGSQFIGWDGTYKGKVQDPGVFVYEAQITFLDNTQTLRTGSVTLIR